MNFKLRIKTSGGFYFCHQQDRIIRLFKIQTTLTLITHLSNKFLRFIVMLRDDCIKF